MPASFKEKSFKASLNHDDVLVNKSKEESKNIKDGYYYINKNIDQAQDIKIYEDDKLSKTLNVKDEKNSQTLNNIYEIYVDDNSANSQILDSIISKDKKYGINLLSKDNMDKFISSFNDSKSLTRVDKGMWEVGDEGVGVCIVISNIIWITRKWEYKASKHSSSSTVSEFKISDSDLTGYILEPNGESTKQSGQDKRIPTGKYNLVWHVSTKYSKDKYSKNKRGNFLENGFPKLYNNDVPKSRAILIHVGSKGEHSEGCLLPGSDVVVSEINGKRYVTGVSGSINKFYQLIEYIESNGIDNVKVVIEEKYEDYK